MRAYVPILCAACGGGPAPSPDGAPPAPAPTLAALRPPEAPLFGAPFALAATGDGFADETIVYLDGAALATHVASPTELTADVPAEALAAPGVRIVSVSGAGGTSGELGLRVVDGIAAPFVDAIVPDRAFAGAGGFELCVRGWNFYPASVVRWGGVPRTTRYVNASRVCVDVSATDVATAGAVAVSVATDGAAPSVDTSFVVEDAPVVAIERLSVTPAGGDSAGAAADPSISDDGRFVAFSSTGNDLVAGDGVRKDVFLRDTCRGASGCTPSTIRISERLGGGDASGDSQDPMISANGRYVAFASAASDLVAGDTNTRTDVFVYDSCRGAAGCTPSIVRAEPPTINFNFAIFPSISGDGRFVAYTANTSSVWLADTCAGAVACTPSVARVDTADDGTPGDRPAESPAISANGRFVAFKSNAHNFDGPQAGFLSHVYVVDTCLGAAGCTRSIRRHDVPADGSEANGSVATGGIALSADGRYLTFSSNATNLVAATTSGFQVYVRDTCAGVAGCTPSTALVSQNAAGDGGDGNAMSSYPTPDGRFVAFQSSASDLVAGDTNGRRDVFVRDTCAGATGCTPVTRKISSGHDGAPADDDSPLVQEYAPRISADGRVTVWTSRATNIVSGDTNHQPDVFVCTGAP